MQALVDDPVRPTRLTLDTPAAKEGLRWFATLGPAAYWQHLREFGWFLRSGGQQGYVVTPLVYGRAAEFNPVTILFSALFFGWLWGPLGVALALPMMILLRGLLVITPDTPALDALADVEVEKAKVQGAPGGS